MTKILFICHGNICRSPMAEFIMKDMTKKAGIDSHFEIASAAVSAEEVGNSIYMPARRELLRHGIDPGNKTARQVRMADFAYYDLIICMDSSNMRRIENFCSEKYRGKVHKLLDFDSGGDVADPWYTGNFEIAWNDIYRGCKALFDTIKEE